MSLTTILLLLTAASLVGAVALDHIRSAWVWIALLLVVIILVLTFT